MTEARSLEKAKANGGFSWTENSFIDRILPKLSGQASKVYQYLTNKVPFNKQAEQITKPLSASMIAEFLKCTGRTVSKALKELEKLEAIAILRTVGKPNSYRLLATYEENFPGDRKESSYGYEESFIPPEKKSSQVEAAKPYGTKLGVPLKNSKSIKISKRVAGVGHGRLASKTGLMNPEDAL